MWQIGAGGSFPVVQSFSSCLNHFLSSLQFVWCVKYSVKVQFKRRSKATHFSCFDSNLRIQYISSVSCFMTETTVTTGSFFPFSPFMNNVPFVLRLLCYYLFMKISRGYWTVVIFYVPLSFLLSCSLFLSLPQHGKPAKWVELQSGSVSGRFRFEVENTKSQCQPNLFLQEDSEGQEGWEISICSATPFPSVNTYSSNLPPTLLAPRYCIPAFTAPFLNPLSA